MKINISKIRYGDKITIDGMNYNKPMTFTECTFEEYNGLYCYDSYCIGVIDEADDNDPSSIYHLFGNDLKRKRNNILNFYSCTDEEHQIEIKRIEKINEEIVDDYERMAEWIIKELEKEEGKDE